MNNFCVIVHKKPIDFNLKYTYNINVIVKLQTIFKSVCVLCTSIVINFLYTFHEMD